MMKNTSKLAYLLGLPVLAGAFIMCFMNVVIGDVSISLPEPLNLHRPQLWSLILGSDEETSAKVTIDTGDLRLKISKGLVMGQGNEASAVASLIGGGTGNKITSVEKSGIGGGNTNEIGSSYSVIGGGQNNNVYNGLPADGGDDGYANAIAGGSYNGTTSGGTVVGGNNNNAAGASVILGGQNNQIGGDGSIALGSNSQGGGNSFSWNSSVAEDYSAIIMASGGTLIGTYEPITGVNLVVEGGVKIGTGELTGNVGEIRMQDGCFYGSDGSEWHVINKRSRANCPKVMCTVGSISFQPGEERQVYTWPYSSDCSQPSVLVTVSCMPDGTLSLSGDFYPYCYDLSGGIWYEGGMAECGAANGGTYVNSPTITDGLCRSGTPSSVVASGNSAFTWTCSTGSSTVSCAATKVYPCNGEQPTGPGVDMGSTTQVYSDTLKSWTPVAQGVSPGVCQWTCAEGYEQQANGCSGDVINEPGGCGTYNPSDFEDLDMYFLTNDGATGHYTLMDRNLGATQVYNGTDNICTYGYYYQWGNNYGFPNTGTVKTSTTMVDASGYGPGNYYSSDTFIKSSHDWSINQNDNLWGGYGSVTDRRGPCPIHYHIPSSSEFRNIVDNYWKESVSEIRGSQFALDFLIPIAGFRNTNSNVVGQSITGAYWYSNGSTSYPGASVHFRFHLNQSNLIAAHSSNRALAMPIRCAKNTPNLSMTLHPNGGTGALIIVHGNEITKLGTPHKGNMVFEGWYSDSSFTPASQVRTGDMVSAGTHLYAKWESSAQCNGVSNVNGEITICNPDNCSECLTMMDKNLGASIAGTGGSSTYGKKYQWGNNYGFPDGSLSSVTTKATWNEIYDNNGYNGNKFIRVSSTVNPQDYWSDGINHSNLRGGGDDSQDNGYGYPVTNLIGRKGPCPSGYHVPSAGELSKLIEWWCVGYQLEGNDVSCQPYSNGLYYITTNETACTRFRADFLIPISYRRSPTTASIQNTNDFSFWWTSSTEGTSSRSLRMRNAHVESESSVRASGFSIRCFKNN